MKLTVGKDNCPWCGALLVAASSGGMSTDAVCACCEKAIWWLEWYASTLADKAAEGQGAYPQAWKGIVDEKVVDMGAPCTTPMPVHVPTMERTAEDIALSIHRECFIDTSTTDRPIFVWDVDTAAKVIRADRLAVVEMCREAIREVKSRLDTKTATDRRAIGWLVEAILALDSVKEKLK